MELKTVKKLDNNGRIHLPPFYRRLLGINDNSYVQITVDALNARILIQRLDECEQETIKRSEL